MYTQSKVLLSNEQRASLEAMIRSGSHPARQLTRARILLLSDRSQGKRRSNDQIAEAVCVSPTTARTIRRRFVQEGMEAALTERPRPGKAPKVTGDVEAHLIALACSDPPAGHARWTLRLMAQQLVALEIVETISHVTVGEALKKTNLNLGASKAGALASRRRTM
jgi:transposase